MAKDAYYFSHDSNAKDDPKCVLLIEQLGLEGYGIYWILIEMLRDQPNYKYPLVLIPAISRRYNTTTEKMKTVVNNYGLFEIDDDNFFSLSLLGRMEHLEELRTRKSIAGKKGNEVRWGITDGSQCDSNGNADGSQSIASKVKESKVNKSKVNKTKVKEIKTEIVKKTFGEKVHLSEDQYEKLVKGNGESNTNEMIEILDNYYLTKAKPPYDSDYHTMVGKGWVLKQMNEDQRKQVGRSQNQKQRNRPKSFDAIDQWAAMTEGMDENE